MPIKIDNELSPTALIQLLGEGAFLNPSFTGAYRMLVNDDVRAAAALLKALNSGQFPIQAFRLMPVEITSEKGKVRNHVLCPDTAVLSQATEYGFMLLREYKPHRGAGLAAQGQLIDLFGDSWKAKTLKGPQVWGYYLPYYNERPKSGDKPEDVLGFVDFPQEDPCCPFVFTGQMNGCHLIVSSSPHAGHLRAWHYQSPGNTPVFTPQNFPFKVFAWITDSDYAGSRSGVDVCGFNFLYFLSGEWFVFSQPQAIGPRCFEEKWGSYVAAQSTKQPFITPLDHAAFKVKKD